MKISRETLHQLIENKLCQAGLKREHAATVAEVLVYADARGIHSHGAVRVEYYAERISKGGTNREPEFRLEETGPCSAILHADNAAGQVAAKMGMEHAIKTAQQNGVAVVGISRMGHSGAISYFVQQAARAGFIGISMCQSDPMVVPFGGAEIYYGTNPWPLPRREKATRSLPLIWRLPYGHGEKCSTPARVICLSRIPGRSIKTVYQQPIRSRYMLCSPPPGQKGMA